MIIISQDGWKIKVAPKDFEVDYSPDVAQYKILVDGKPFGYYKEFQTAQFVMDEIAKHLIRDEDYYYMKSDKDKWISHEDDHEE